MLYLERPAFQEPLLVERCRACTIRVYRKRHPEFSNNIPKKLKTPSPDDPLMSLTGPRCNKKLCTRTCELRVSTSEKNPNRQYWCCPEKEHGFFSWAGTANPSATTVLASSSTSINSAVDSAEMAAVKGEIAVMQARMRQIEAEIARLQGQVGGLYNIQPGQALMTASAPPFQSSLTSITQ